MFICITLFSLHLRHVPCPAVQSWRFQADLNHFNLLNAELWGAAGSAQKTAVLSVPEPWKDRSGGRSLSSLSESHSFYMSEVGQNQNKLPDPKSVVYFDLQYCDQVTVPKCLSPSRTSEEFRCLTSLDCWEFLDLLFIQKGWDTAIPTASVYLIFWNASAINNFSLIFLGATNIHRRKDLTEILSLRMTKFWMKNTFAVKKPGDSLVLLK